MLTQISVVDGVSVPFWAIVPMLGEDRELSSPRMGEAPAGQVCTVPGVCCNVLLQRQKGKE